MEVYQKIRNYLTRQGIKQIHLSRKTGINNKVLNASLNGKRKFRVEEFRDICVALNVSSEKFLGGKKNV